MIARIALTFSLLGVCLLGGCKNRGADSCNPDDYAYERVFVHLQSGADLNLDEDGNPLPTVVRVYQLSGDLATRSLDFEELWHDHEAALGDEYLAHSELQIYPDSAEQLEVRVDPSARYLLVFGGFQQPVGNSWYRIYPLPDSYGAQACELRAQAKDPAALGQPCAYLLLERNQIDGGETAPPGFDAAALETTCTPLRSPEPAP